MTGRRRDLKEGETLRDTDVAAWIKKRLKDERIVAIFTFAYDGSDATVHFLCDQPYEPDVPASLDLCAEVIAAAQRSVKPS
jgi:hypothetical protein